MRVNVNAERDRVRGCLGLGLYPQDAEEEQVRVRLVWDMGSTASNRDSLSLPKGMAIANTTFSG